MKHSTTKRNSNPSRVLLGRELRLFLKEVPAALLMAVLLGLFCALAFSSLSAGGESGYTPAPVAVVDGDGFVCPMQPGEYLLLCTDGLVNTVTDQEIWETVLRSATPEESLARMLEISKSRGAPDNVTCTLVAV